MHVQYTYKHFKAFILLLKKYQLIFSIPDVWVTKVLPLHIIVTESLTFFLYCAFNIVVEIFSLVSFCECLFLTHKGIVLEWYLVLARWVIALSNKG